MKNDPNRITVKKEDGEWICVAYINGKRHEPSTYYAADKDDAERTAEAMRAAQGA